MEETAVGSPCWLFNCMYIFKVLFMCVDVHSFINFINGAVFIFWTTQTVLLVKNFEREWSCTKWLFDLFLYVLNVQTVKKKKLHLHFLVFNQKTHSLHWELLDECVFTWRWREGKEMKDNPILFLLACLWKYNEINRTSQSPGTICLCSGGCGLPHVFFIHLIQAG